MYQHLLDLISGKGSENDQVKTLEKKVKDLEEKLQLLIYKQPPDFSGDISKLFAQVEYLKTELEKRAESEAVVQMFEALKAMKIQSAGPSQDYNELWKFREKTLKDFEKVDEKFEKISKALDLTSIKRALASKANTEETKEEFLSVGQRLINLEQNDIEIAKEIDRINAYIRKIMQMIEDLGSKSGFALISKKSWASNCLSCGRGDSSYIPTIPHVQGYDGKFYKADMTSFRPGMTDPNWKRHEEEEYIPNKSPISLSKLQKPALNALLGKDLIKSLSSTAISPSKRFRPSSARK